MARPLATKTQKMVFQLSLTKKFMRIPNGIVKNMLFIYSISRIFPIYQFKLWNGIQFILERTNPN